MTPEIGSTDTLQITHPSGRVQIQPLPNSLPGKCTVCGASDNTDGRQYVDIGFEIDFYGVVYFCTHCVSEIAVAIGYRSPSLFKDIEDENRSFVTELAELSAENVKLRVALNNLDFLGTAGNIEFNDSGDKKPVEQKRPDNPEPAKQITKPGRTDVPKAGKLKSTELDIENFDT